MEQKNMLPGLTREAEEQKLQEIIGIAQQNLERARADIRKVNEDLEDLLDVYEAQDKEGLALWNNATARLKENEYDLVRYEKARRKPYFGRIDFKDPNVKGDESYYIGRVGIAKNNSEPVVLDWRAPIASVYYESGLGPCQYTVSSEGTFTIDLKRKRTYEIENDHLKDFFDSDVVANDELLTKYLAKNKKAVLSEIIATIQKEQNLIIRRFTHGMQEQKELEEKNMPQEVGSFTRFPDIIMMDGGRGQVNICLQVLEELGLDIPVCGMVKDDNHRTRGLYFHNVEIPIDRHGEGFKLITRIQDEAHRFAIEYHRSLRSKTQVHSILDDIEGIGPARRKALMRRFQSMENMKNASVEELAETDSMNLAAAQNVYDTLHSGPA